MRSTRKDSSAEDAIVLGDNLRFAGRLEEAALILERAAHENPAFAQPLISLAEVRIQEHKPMRPRRCASES